MNDDKKAFDTIGDQMSFINNSIKNVNKFNGGLPEYEDEKVSACCAALMTMGKCMNCKEPTTPVDPDDEDLGSEGNGREDLI